MTSPLGLVTHYLHDANGRVTQATAPDGRQFGFQRDASGNITAVFPPGPGGDHHFAFDARNLVSKYTPSDIGPGDESTFFNYTPDEQSSSVLRPDGGLLTPLYDAAGRLTALSSPSGTMTRVYSNSGPTAGKLVQAASPDGVTQALSYQGALVSGVVWSGPVAGDVEWQYDSQFRAFTETIGGAQLGRIWNADGQLISAGNLQISYDPTTGILTGTSLDQVHDTILWNGFGEPTSYSADGASNLLTRTYQRDDAGRITQVTESLAGATPVTRVYAYDAAGRLTDVSKDGAAEAHYTYDVHGNRTSATYAGQPSLGATFDAQDRSLSFGAISYTHAITGERLSKTVPGVGTTTYGYDAFSQLKSVALPDGTLVEYLYDAAGRRVAKKVDGVYTQRFVYGDADGPAALVDENGVVLERYVYATSASVPDYVVKVSGGQTTRYRLIKDERGSVRLVVASASSVIVQAIEYDAYGRVVSDTSPGFTPFGFAGGLWDADTGLVRFGARDYDPETGRWTTRDPIGLGGGDSNLYAYVGGDPINGIDPSGKAVETGNFAMDSALNGGALAWLGFQEFAEGMYNFRNGVLELSDDSTFNQGIKDMRKGACQMVSGGLKVIDAGHQAMAVVAIAGAIARGWSPGKQLWSKGKERVHFKDHGAGVGAATKAEYTAMATEFGSAANNGRFIEMEYGPYLYRYEPATDRIFVGTFSGERIKTFYRWDGRSDDLVINALKAAGLL